ncbi:MAG: glycosyltransferase family 39 protein [Snowella sp.]|nr:glycosyltransferase family 39 protein [Snowella sp.]
MQLQKILDFKNYNDQQWTILFTIAAIFLWLINLGGLSLRDWDEGYYATVSQDMFQRNSWLYPTYQGEPFLLKPPLIFWLIHLSYLVFNITDFSSRLPSAFIAALGVPLIYLIGREIFVNRSAAIFTASVYLTLLPVVRLGRLAMLDGIVNTFFLLAIFGLVKGKKSPHWLIVIGIGLGLITLTKGVLVLALGAILLIYIFLDKQYKILFNPYLWLGLILGFIPVFIWYGLQIHHYGETFIQVHFQSQSFDRLSTAVEGNTGPIWFYLVEALKYSAPWLFFCIPGFYFAVKDYQQSWAKLILIGGAVYLGTISLMTTKLPWYIMPFYVFFALATGVYLDQLWQYSRKYPKLIFYLLVLCGVVGLGGSIYFAFFEQKGYLVLISLTLGSSLLFTAFQFFKNRPQFIPALIIGLYLTLIFLMLSPVWVWELNEAFPVKPVAQLIKQSTPENTMVYTSFPYSRTSLDFYSDRHVIAADENKLQDLLTQSSYLLLEEAFFDKIKNKNYRILGKTEGFVLILSNPS